MSPCYIRLLTPEGLQSVDYSADSLADAVRYEPEDGVYTVSNTYNTFQVLKLDAHLDRLEDSARRARMPLTIDRARLRRSLRDMIADAGFGDVRFRISVARDAPQQFILSLEPFTPPPPELIERGARCVTLTDRIRYDPAAKTTNWLHQRREISLPPGSYDGFLTDAAGNILEGLSSNFYAVLDEELRTAGEGVLPGIAQQIVFEIAPHIAPLRRAAVNRRDVPHLREAFLTSSSRGIVPVVEIDGVAIGQGTPGAITKALRAAYVNRVAELLEEL